MSAAVEFGRRIRASKGVWVKPYSGDVHRKVLGAVLAERGSRAQIAAMFDVSRRFVDKVVKRHRTGEPVGPKRGHVGQPKIRGADVDLLRRLVAEQPDATLEELVGALVARGGPRVSVTTMCTTLERLKLPRKKSRSTR